MSSESHFGYGFRLQDMQWTLLAPGLREKSHECSGRRFRILEFSEPFRETDWCVKGHAGYVLEGEIVVNVDGTRVTYRRGDVIDLQEGIRHRHETTVAMATVFLIEKTASQAHRG